MANERTRVWRRANHERCEFRGNFTKDEAWKGEKCWKLMYLRSEMLHRAQKLGKVWPRQEWLKLLADSEPIRVLFVCSRNQWRSPTGERVWGAVSGVAVRSAGTSRNARRRLTVKDLRWADLILVMEQKHKSRIEAEYRDEIRFKSLYVLDILDNYRFMDPDLVEILTEKSEPLIYGTRPKREY